MTNDMILKKKLGGIKTVSNSTLHSAKVVTRFRAQLSIVQLSLVYTENASLFEAAFLFGREAFELNPWQHLDKKIARFFYTARFLR